MMATFSDRMNLIGHISENRSKEIALMMINCWTKCDETYESLRRSYNAAMEDIEDDPGMICLRHKLFGKLLKHVGNSRYFGLSELVDLTVYYFNFVDSSTCP